MLFVPSTNSWCVRNKLLEYACPVWNSHQAFFHKLDHVQRNTVRVIVGNDASFEHRLKTLNSPTLYLRKDCLGLLQLFEIIKSGFAANLEDCMFFNKRETPVYTRVFHRKHSYGIISLYSLSDFFFFSHI